MRKTYYLLAISTLFILCLSHCGHPATPVFKPGNLSPFSAEVDITRDTVLRAPEGSLIHIPAHALDAGGATKVRLLIREALRISDIIRAGLLTTSDGNPLSSGGMIDIIPGYILIAWWPDRLPAAKEGISPLYTLKKFFS